MNNTQQVYINIFGPICSGKSAVGKVLHGKMPKAFLISNDRIKWFISGYETQNDRPTISLMVFDLVKRAIEGGYSVIRASNIHKESPEQIEMYENLLEESQIRYFEFKLDASLPTLESRYKERLQHAEKNGTKLTVKDKEKFMRYYQAYQDAITPMKSFNTETMTAEEIADQIILEVQNAQS